MSKKMLVRKINWRNYLLFSLVAVVVFALVACAAPAQPAAQSTSQGAEQSVDQTANECNPPKLDTITLAFVPKALNNPVFEITPAARKTASQRPTLGSNSNGWDRRRPMRKRSHRSSTT